MCSGVFDWLSSVGFSLFVTIHSECSEWSAVDQFDLWCVATETSSLSLITIYLSNWPTSVICSIFNSCVLYSLILLLMIKLWFVSPPVRTLWILFRDLFLLNAVLTKNNISVKQIISFAAPNPEGHPAHVKTYLARNTKIEKFKLSEESWDVLID